MSNDGRYDKLMKYKRIIDSFSYAGLKREEAEDLLRLGFRLYEDSQHMNEVKNRIQQLENVVEKQKRTIKRFEKEDRR